MLLVSMKVNKKLISLLCGVAGVIILVAAVSGLFGEKKEMAASISSTGAVTKNYTVTTNDQRLEFIAQFGWEVENEPCEIEEILIPKDFDTVYQNYNAIQKVQGLDLTRYAGKMVKKYTYRIVNYPGCDDEVRLNLLTAENKVIGGDVCSLALEGFMHGFKYEGESAAQSAVRPESTDRTDAVSTAEDGVTETEIVDAQETPDETAQTNP